MCQPFFLLEQYILAKNNVLGYLLNLIDTPGHADFGFEVARSITACDGMILLVAANAVSILFICIRAATIFACFKGVQAQTLANFWLGFEQELAIIPAINKVDLKGSETEAIKTQLTTLFGFDTNEILCISAKTGLNTEKLLEAVIERFAAFANDLVLQLSYRIPPPSARPTAPFRALIFDSRFDHFRGAIALIVVKDGSVARGQSICALNSGNTYTVAEGICFCFTCFIFYSYI